MAVTSEDLDDGSGKGRSEADWRIGRTGRRAGPTETRGLIVRVARQLFAVRGYAGTTLRAIAVEAGVDAALIHHFYKSKQLLFVTVVSDVLAQIKPIDGAKDDAGERLVREYLRLWEDPETGASLRAIFGSAVSHDEAAGLLSQVIAEHLVKPVVAGAGARDAEPVTTLISSQLVGLALMRFVAGAGPLATLTTESLVTRVGGYFQSELRR
jgi:AcrR family transcriptional regulator